MTQHDGSKVAGGFAVARTLARLSFGPLYPAGPAAGRIDSWLDAAQEVAFNARAWAGGVVGEYDDSDRAKAQARILRALDALEAHLARATYLVGEAHSLADLGMLHTLFPLFSMVLGAPVQARYPGVVRWLKTCAARPTAVQALGSGGLSPSAAEWTVPQAPAAPGGKKSKKSKKKNKPGAAAGAGAGAEAAPAPAAPAGPLDPEKEAAKAAKKAKKQAEKEAKAAKLAAKKAKLAAAASAAPKKKDPKKAKLEAEKAAKKAAAAAAEAAALEKAEATPKGQKKDVSQIEVTGYSPKIVEAAWYDWWEQSGFFRADPRSKKPKFTIVIPPPNVTGSLHLGHALTNSIQDTICRWRRMSGFDVLWVPGTDHAGIATQTVVEKKLARERGVTRHDLGREKFLEEVYEWVGEYGGKICAQLRKLGSSLDWEMERFTMDATLSKAVKEAFVRMQEQGLIYRDNRLVNWCCNLKTAVSDIEVDYIDIPGRTMLAVPGYEAPVEFGAITSFAYPLEDGSGEIVVATTRIETMLGDTAVAVHPEDPRYAHLHGTHVVHPVNGRKIPIITDAILVDMSFGTGAVKITPAHDPNDFATGQRHKLESINVLDDEGRINGNGTGEFRGMKRFECRVKIMEFLDAKGLLRGKQDNPMRLGLCSRSKDVIEPILKPQWWVDCKQMAADACAAARDGRLEIIPPEFNATWFRWLENIRDWCISRQLWWGHRIPAYYVTFEGQTEAESGRPGAPSEHMRNWVIGRDEAEALAAAEKLHPGKKIKLIQDEDVLDTWFSSGLFPFSVFNWPDQTAELGAFYPTSLLETGHDILFFWVARMVMMGMNLTGQVPFSQVYLHSMVRDAHGRKMSKSLGNVIDPLHVIGGISLEGLHETLLGGNLDAKEVKKAQAGQKADYPNGIEECGTDALRFALVSYTSQGRDINLDIKRVVAYRHWCNKLWNAIRYASKNLGEGFVPDANLDVPALPLACRWVLSRLNAAVRTTVQGMEAYDFSGATTATYAWWQYDLCDVFIELMKPVVVSDDEAVKAQTRQTLWHCLDIGLRLLHPFMPFVTEELWQRLPKAAAMDPYPSIMVAPYPIYADAIHDPAAEAAMGLMNTVVNKIRSLRTDYGLHKQKPECFLLCKGDAAFEAASAVGAYVATLSSCEKVTATQDAGAVPPGCGVAIVDGTVSAYLVLKGIVDFAAEIKKLQKNCDNYQKQIATVSKKVANPQYQEKTPEKVKAADLEKMARLEAELATAKKALADFQALAAEAAA